MIFSLSPPSPFPSQKSDRADAETATKRQQFLALVRRHQARLLRTARRLYGATQGQEDAIADLVQDTILSAYQAVIHGQFSLAFGPGEERREIAWLLRILTNTFINSYRRRQRWEAGIAVEEVIADRGEIQVGPQASAGDIPGEALLAGTLDEVLEAALATLPEGHRFCIILCEIEGLDYTEAAAILEIPVGTVRSRLSRARILLQKHLHAEAIKRRWR